MKQERKHAAEIDTQSRVREVLSVPKQCENVMTEYLRNATPGVGTVTCGEGYNVSRHAEEIKTAQWLHENLGGDIVLLNESSEQKIKMPDFVWKEHYWELKNVASVNSADLAFRHAAKQIASCPGGVTFQLSDCDIDLEKLRAQLFRRFQHTELSSADVILIAKNNLVEILRCKK